MAKLGHGTIAARQITPVAIHRGLIIRGTFVFSAKIYRDTFFNLARDIRCFVGDQHDQWRTCSERYYPTTKAKRPGHTAANAFAASSNKKKVVVGPYHQAPPRPGGLEDVAAARLWPVTYLYSSGPPNSTELSNFVDCNKESC